jgi:hypothetical protein
MRLIIYIFCCGFNVYASWSLEEGERKSYFLSTDLERKLASEKEKLRVESITKSKAERVLVSYLCHEVSAFLVYMCVYCACILPMPRSKYCSHRANKRRSRCSFER